MCIRCIINDINQCEDRSILPTFELDQVNSYYNPALNNNDSDIFQFYAPQPIDSLIWENAAFDSTQPIKVHFVGENSIVYDEGFSIRSDGFTASDVVSISKIFDNVSSFANINFEYTDDQTEADIRLVTSDFGDGLYGYMYPQGTSLESDGLGVLNSNPEYWNNSSNQTGGFMNSVIIHELGHGLGLAHTHDTGGGSSIMEGVSSPGDTGDYLDMNQTIFSIMSYNDGWEGHPLGLPQDLSAGYMSTFGALDIAALQSIYGINETYNNDDTTYELGSAEYFQTIWDTGGNDEILVISDAGSVVDLRPATLKYEIGGAGNVSYAYDLRGGHTIAANTIIENVVGGDGNDQITGNHVSNNLFGNSGNDIIAGGKGNDYLYGGSGFDQFIINSGDGIDRIIDFNINEDSLLFYNSEGGNLNTVNIEDVGKTRSEDGSRKYELNDQTAFILSGILNYEAEGEALIVNNISNNGTLNADVTEISDYDGLGSFTFQWFRNELEVSGANLQQYFISEEDNGCEISYSCSYIDSFGSFEKINSDNLFIDFQLPQEEVILPQEEVIIETTDVSSDETTTASMQVGGTYTGKLETSGDRDWVAVDLIAGGNYEVSLYGIGENGVEDTILTIFDQSGYVVGYDDDGGVDYNSKLSFDTQYSGTYFIEANSYDGLYTGDYELSLNQLLQNTDVSSDETTTASMQVGGTYTGKLETSGDRDWVAVDLIAGGNYEVSLYGIGENGVEDTILTIFDQSGYVVGYDDDGGVDYNSKLSFDTQYSGTYFIEANSYDGLYTGDYELSLNQLLQNTDVSSDETTTASMQVGGTYTGKLETSGDRDWVAVDLIAGGNYEVSLYGIGENGVEDTILTIFDQSGYVVGYDDDGGVDYNSKLSFDTQYSGTYFIEANSYDGLYTGDYELSLNQLLQNTDVSSDETTTASMQVGGTYTGKLETSGDRDWVAVDLIAGGNYEVSLYGIGENGVEDTILTIFDQSGYVVGYDDDGGVDYNSKLSFDTQYSGTYFIEANSYDGLYTGDYELSLNQLLQNTDESIYIRGTIFSDNIVGGNGDDTLIGRRGADSIFGGRGQDHMFAGGRRDTDTDIFLFSNIDESGIGSESRDQIRQFDTSEDLIDLSSIDANIFENGNQSFDFSFQNPAPYSVWYQNEGRNTLIQGDVNGDLVLDFEVEIIRCDDLCFQNLII